MKEKAVLLALKLPAENKGCRENSLEELCLLAETAGAEVVASFIQEKNKPNSATYFGKGKITEIAEVSRRLNADIIISDDELTPTQERNLHKLFKIKVIDRTGLILDIFAQRAHTNEGKLQVELAQLRYLMTKLSGKGLLMSRLGGGIGTRGPGETQLEVDRRKIRNRISNINRQLKRVRIHRKLLRDRRKNSGMPVIALIGYTNAGKTTLFNNLSFSYKETQNKLFVTLDPVARLVVLQNKQRFILTDTVGFINKLPHQLIAAFKATLEELYDSDMLLHVVDCSHPHAEEQMKAVLIILDELGVGNKPILTIFNKIDKIDNQKIVERLSGEYEDSVSVSALYGTGIENLINKLSSFLKKYTIKVYLTIPYQESHLLSRIYSTGRIIEIQHLAKSIMVYAEIPNYLKDYFAKNIIDKVENLQDLQYA